MNDVDPSLPEQIGPYQLEGEIGKGGMGSVYRAYDQRLARAVALKRIRADALLAPGNRRRLHREAQATAQLSHPNIVQIFDILEDHGKDWIVMELVEGQSLAHVLRARNLDTKEALQLGLDLAKGLSAAHAQGIVHRDLKAENVMVMATGTAKILDFGLAKWHSGDGNSSVSEEATVRGTPRSMSPEQILGQPIDHRSDLFSLGVLLYEALTGHSPFHQNAKTVFQILNQVCTLRQKSLHEHLPDIPRQFSDLVDQMLEKQPEHRPQGIETVVVELQRIRDTPATQFKMLFVDDEPDFERLIRQRYRRKIRQGDMHVEFAGDGVEALEKLARDPEIRLVLTDINMPRMDGLSLLRELGTLEQTPVALILSAYGDMKNIRTAMNLGAFDFLTKPIDFKDLDLTLLKASDEVSRIQEDQRLRQENQLLDQRNRVIRDAFARYLSGDPRVRKLFDPLLHREASARLRSVTVLRAVLEGFVALPDQLDPAALFELSNRLFQDLIDLIRRFDGAALDYRDGEILIGFGLPFPREDDAARAVDCAVALRQSLEASSAAAGVDLSAKIVIDTGNLYLERFGSGLGDPDHAESQGSEERRISGPVTERMGQILVHCDDGEILVSGETLEHYSGELSTEVLTSPTIPLDSNIFKVHRSPSDFDQTHPMDRSP